MGKVVRERSTFGGEHLVVVTDVTARASRETQPFSRFVYTMRCITIIKMVRDMVKEIFQYLWFSCSLFKITEQSFFTR